MLVLSRQRDESIIIGENIVITVVDIRGDVVRLGVKAEKAVSVDRAEIRDRKRKITRRIPAASLPPEHR